MNELLRLIAERKLSITWENYPPDVTVTHYVEGMPDVYQKERQLGDEDITNTLIRALTKVRKELNV